jgi:nucleotide-binding universal stress UspA family protein
MKVLLPTDGSEFSKAAIKKCCKLFDKSEKTEIRIISAVEPAITSAEPYAISAEYTLARDTTATERANEVVAQAKAEVHKSFPDLVARFGVTTKVVNGSPMHAIVEEAENWGADLIIMGSHGYSFWQRSLLGSVSDFVVHHAPCSVLVVRTPEETNGNRD